MSEALLNAMTHKDKVVLFVMGTLQDLKTKGFVEGGLDLSESGYAAFVALKGEGFSCTQEEMEEVMRFLTNGKAIAAFCSKRREGTNP